MSKTIEIKIPDIGGFDDVPVIEVMVKPGDAVQAEDSLLTLEFDKATMDVPSPAAGTIKSVKVKVGDKVSEGTLIALLEVTEAAAIATPAPAVPLTAAPAASREAPKAAPIASTYSGSVDIECELLVLGAGPGGYSA